MFAKELFNVVFSKIKSRSKMRFLLEVFEFFEKRYHQKRLPFNHFPKRRDQILELFLGIFALGEAKFERTRMFRKDISSKLKTFPYKLLRKTYVCRSMAFPKCHNHPFWTRLFQEGERDDACIHSRVSLNFSKRSRCFSFFQTFKLFCRSTTFSKYHNHPSWILRIFRFSRYFFQKFLRI